MKKTLAIFMLCTITLSHAPVVFAADYDSQNFRSSNPQLDDFGSSGTSTSFYSISAGGQMSTGESTSTSFTLAAGAMYFDTFLPRAGTWRWYDDETNETPTTALAAENVAPVNIENLNSLKLRVAVLETANIGKEGAKFRLQFSTVGDFSSGVRDVVEESTCAGGSGWCYANGVDLDNAVISTSLLTSIDPCSGGVGVGCGTHNESGTSTTTFVQYASSTTEYEFTITQSGAVANTVYFFRLVDVTSSSSVPLFSGSSYPSLTTGGTEFTLSISGVATSTTVAGVSTSVGTTPTSVPFGTLPQSTSVSGAHTFTVTTNAGGGYTIYAYQMQALLGSSGGQIAPVTGTNASPVSWLTGCNSTTTGCYGYHTTESVLQGGSTRFAPNDTYARFAQSLEEVAYSSGPATNKTTTLLYRVAVENLQGAGAYDSSVVYIAVPTF